MPRTRLAASSVAVAALVLAAPLASPPSPAHADGVLPPRVSTPPGSGVLVAVDAGGNDATGSWSADDGYVGGRASDPVPTEARAGEAPAAVTATSREGASFTYRLRRLTPGAGYTVRTHHVENDATGPAQRLFDITVDGVPAVTGLDVFTAAGGKGIPVHRDLAAAADADGVITLTFHGTRGSATLAGIEVIGARPATRLGSALQLRDLHVTPLGPTATHISWRPVPGARYAVLRDGVVIGRTRDAALVDTGARAGTTHRYTAAAIDPDGSLGLLARARSVRMPSATPHATGVFHTEGSRIIDPAGREFVPLGVNLGSRATMDYAGAAAGHAADAKAWGWNIVRILVKPGWWDEDALRSLVAEYRAAGLVVMIDAHDYWDADVPDADTRRARTKDMWARLAPEYKNDSGVWFDLANEPGYLGDDWYEFTAELAETVRAAGADNIIVAEAPTWGQDLGNHGGYFTGARFAYEAPYAPTVAARYGNTVLGQHNYGARYSSTATYSAYVDAVQSQGLPLLSSEFGYAQDGVSGAGSYELNRLGAKAVFEVNPTKKVGIVVWNGNVGDPMSLKQDRSAFWVGGITANLSELGRDLWAVNH